MRRYGSYPLAFRQFGPRGLGLGVGGAQSWWPAGAILALDFVNNRYMRNGAVFTAASFTVVGGSFDQSASGLEIVSGDTIYLDVSACDLENPGTVVWDGTPGATADTNARLWSLTNAASTGNDYVYAQLSGAAVNVRLRAAAGTTITPANQAYTPGDPLRHAASWDATDVRHSANGRDPVITTTGTAPTSGTFNRLYLGNNFGGTAPIAGYIRSIYAYRQKAT